MAGIELHPDDKGQASFTLGDVIVQTRDNFPDPKYRPRVHLDTPQYHIYGINPFPHQIWVTADGIGTKPEMAERLFSQDGNPEHFSTLAFDTLAMVESDEARFGRFILGAAQVIDTNNAENQGIISALARGMKNAADQGRFAILNGETAELGYRASGYGESRVNWNAVGVSLVVPDKLILGDRLEAGQPVVVLRETSIRSNGLTKARNILEASFLQQGGYPSKRDYFISELSQFLEGENLSPNYETTLKLLTGSSLMTFMDNITGHSYTEQLLLPWHDLHSETATKLLKPSKLYSPLIYDALGGPDGEKLVDITAAAHISGGGVPEKGRRMVEPRGLGLVIDSPFPDPEAVTDLLNIAQKLPNGEQLINDRVACQQWNRGIGFMVATATLEDADNLVKIASDLGYEAAIAGQVTSSQEVQFRGYTWTY